MGRPVIRYPSDQVVAESGLLYRPAPGANSGAVPSTQIAVRKTNKSNEMEAEIQALRERLSRLSAAVLRISSSLDLDTVLREVVESARALTGARYGVICPPTSGHSVSPRT